jgi:hypothetical protein
MCLLLRLLLDPLLLLLGRVLILLLLRHVQQQLQQARLCIAQVPCSQTNWCFFCRLFWDGCWP